MGPQCIDRPPGAPSRSAPVPAATGKMAGERGEKWHDKRGTGRNLRVAVGDSRKSRYRYLIELGRKLKRRCRRLNTTKTTGSAAACHRCGSPRASKPACTPATAFPRRLRCAPGQGTDRAAVWAGVGQDRAGDREHGLGGDLRKRLGLENHITMNRRNGFAVCHGGTHQGPRQTHTTPSAEVITSVVPLLNAIDIRRVETKPRCRRAPISSRVRRLEPRTAPNRKTPSGRVRSCTRWARKSPTALSHGLGAVLLPSPASLRLWWREAGPSMVMRVTSSRVPCSVPRWC